MVAMEQSMTQDFFDGVLGNDAVNAHGRLAGLASSLAHLVS